MTLSALELDPRWEWIYAPTLGGLPGAEYIRGRCNHLEVLAVHAVTGTHVGDLCWTCKTLFRTEPADPSRPCDWTAAR
jgi:hypothetical protein